MSEICYTSRVASSICMCASCDPKFVRNLLRNTVMSDADLELLIPLYESLMMARDSQTSTTLVLTPEMVAALTRVMEVAGEL